MTRPIPAGHQAIINEATELAYEMDDDRDRRSIRYFAPPEHYIQVAYDTFVAKGLIKDPRL